MKRTICGCEKLNESEIIENRILATEEYVF